MHSTLLLLGTLFFVTNNFSPSRSPTVNHQANFTRSPKYSPKDEIVLLSLGYPVGKNESRYNIFINRKKVARINPGERITIQLSNESTYAICIDESQVYKEPATLSANSRTLSMKTGKQYYFLIGNKGQLEYMFNPDAGAKAFNKTSEYKSATPTLITASETGVIPSL